MYQRCGTIRVNARVGMMSVLLRWVCTLYIPGTFPLERRHALTCREFRSSLICAEIRCWLSHFLACLPAFAQQAASPVVGHYLFAWTGDEKQEGNDFLAVIDADPDSATYGKLVTTVGTDQKTVRIHHTEYVMPASGMLFANDHDVGRTFIFDVNDPLHPKVVTSFTDMAGYMHPHSFVRLPNGNVIATFQHAHHGRDTGKLGATGGLVEIDDRGKVVRSVSTADPAFPDALLMPYSVAVLPEQDRIVSTNSSMHDPDLLSGVTYQVWRLSDLKLLKTAYFDPGAGHYAHIAPEEPRVAADGSVYVQTLGCGIERITGLTTKAGREAGPHFPGQLVRRPDDRGQLPHSIRAGDPWPDRARHLESRQTQGGFATLVERRASTRTGRGGMRRRSAW